MSFGQITSSPDLSVECELVLIKSLGRKMHNFGEGVARKISLWRDYVSGLFCGVRKWRLKKRGCHGTFN